MKQPSPPRSHHKQSSGEVDSASEKRRPKGKRKNERKRYSLFLIFQIKTLDKIGLEKYFSEQSFYKVETKSHFRR